MNSFLEATERLKKQLGVSDDKAAATALGLGTTAWAMRKKRDSFPTKEVFALAQQRPELGLDPDWIVTGASHHIETEGSDEAGLLECYRVLGSRDKQRLREIAMLWAGTVEFKLKSGGTK